jgi:hypothetical protein
MTADLAAEPLSRPIDARARADESVATRFSRVMNATTSPLGVLTDPPLIAVVTAIFFIAFLAAVRMDLAGLVPVFGVIAAAPVATAILTGLALTGGRKKVVDWLARVPFPLENMNAVLNGVGESLEVVFEGDRPTAADLNAKLEQIHADTFIMRHEPEENFIEVRIGVVDSKRNPSATNHARYARVQRIVDEVLVPLAKEHPIASVRVK